MYLNRTQTNMIFLDALGLDVSRASNYETLYLTLLYLTNLDTAIESKETYYQDIVGSEEPELDILDLIEQFVMPGSID